jgi:hypothetical protein
MTFLCLVTLMALAKESPKPVDTDIDFDVVGTVTESGTGRPIEGAYVAVNYRLRGSGPDPRFGGAAECRKVKGAYTDRNGAFRIPAERVDGLVTAFVYAAAPGFYVVQQTSPAPTRHEIRTTPLPSVPLELRKRLSRFEIQGDGNLWTFHNDYTNVATSQYGLDCWKAASREDAAPALPYLRIVQRESVKHGGTAEHHWTIERIVFLLESLPRRSGAKAAP